MTVSKPSKRKKRKGHYHTGFHTSPKCRTVVEYRSGWEQAVCVYLDGSSDVVAYAYEAVAIPYLANLRAKKLRKYYPDFFIKYTDGRKVIVEVKRADKLSNPLVMKKAAAARLWCERYGYDYEFWTNEKIKQIKLMNESHVKH